MAVTKVTFIGGPECGNIGSTTMGNPATHEVVFPINQAVTIDTDAPENQTIRQALEAIVRKARGNRFFVVDDPDGGMFLRARVTEPVALERPRRGRPPKQAFAPVVEPMLGDEAA